MLAVLAGNPNCGKSTVFNALTGRRQNVGNLPGVTVDTATACVKNSSGLALADVPGIYSLTPFTPEESPACEWLTRGEYDVVVNVVDVTALRRGLYLSVQLACLGRPMVVALNMADELKADDLERARRAIERRLGVSVVAVSALYGTGLSQLKDEIKKAEMPRAPYPSGQAGLLLRELAQLCGGKDALFLAYSMLEGRLPPETAAQKTMYGRFARECGDPLQSAVAAKYAVADEMCASAGADGFSVGSQRKTRAADKILLNPRLGVPVLAAVMAFVFWFSFWLVGPALSGLYVRALSLLERACAGGLGALRAPFWLLALCSGGIFKGLEAVAEFLPSIACVLFMLSLLEDCGYLARVACLLDAPMSFLGLSGRCAVPFMLSFGCSVTAELSAQTVRSERQRRVCAAAIPYFPCGARLTVCAALCSALFGAYARAALLTVLLLGVGCAAGVSAVCALRGGERGGGQLLMELPVYRFPSAENVLRDVLYKIGAFVGKLLVTVIAASAAVWALAYFGAGLRPAADAGQSLLAAASSWLVPAFEPLGLGDWRAVSALLSGLVSKEAVVGTLAVVYPEGAFALFSPQQGIVFLVFTALYPPCISTLWAMRRVQKKLLLTLFSFFAQLAVAYAAALLFCKAAQLFA